MKNRKRRSRLTLTTQQRFERDLLFSNNPVFVAGLGLAPVVGAAVSLRYALIICLAMLVILTPTRVLGNLFVGIVPQRLRPMVYALFSAALYIPALWLVYRFFNMEVSYIGIYLPMLVLDSIVLSRSEIPRRERFFESIGNGIKTTIGFCVAICAVGALREILGSNRILGVRLNMPFSIPILSTTAGGFIVVALLAAFVQWAVAGLKRARYKEERENA